MEEVEEILRTPDNLWEGQSVPGLLIKESPPGEEVGENSRLPEELWEERSERLMSVRLKR